MSNEVEISIVVLARQRFKALKVGLAGRHADLNFAQNTFHQLTGLTSIRFVQDNGLSEQTLHELSILDNLAVLHIQTAHPEIIEKLSKEAQELSHYIDMPARELLDLLFKKGERFSNHDAISVAMHRGLIHDVQHEAEAYQELTAREHREQLRRNHAH
jgi:hypothetical protein